MTALTASRALVLVVALLARSVLSPNNAAGQLQSVTSSAGGAASFTYYADGRLQTETLPNNVSRTYTYDAAGRALTLAQSLNGQAENYSFDYTDPLGRLKTQSLAGHWSTAFVYDSAGRLASETRTGEGAYSNSYSYNAGDHYDRGSQTVVTGSQTYVLRFDGAAVPPEFTPVSGTWTVGAGKLHGSGTDLARGNGGAGLRLSVKVKPDTSQLNLTNVKERELLRS